jgi:hypothetical protein
MIKNPFPTHNTSQQEAQQKASAVARWRRAPVTIVIIIFFLV